MIYHKTGAVYEPPQSPEAEAEDTFVTVNEFRTLLRLLAAHVDVFRACATINGCNELAKAFRDFRDDLDTVVAQAYSEVKS